MSQPEQFDHVIVGAGSAGCVLANRLSEDPDLRVLLLEAGGRDWSPFIRMPSALSIPMNSKQLDWGYHSEPEPGLDGRRLHCPRGRVLGGSSSINGMVCVRGHASDFDGWAAAGAEGWDWAGVLPYFRRAEHFQGGPGDQHWPDWPDDGYRGTSGPLATSRGAMANPLYGVFLAAAEQAGYPLSADLNGYQQEGFGALDMTVSGGVRMSTAVAYLRPARQRPNLVVRTGVLVDRVHCQAGRADTVSYRHRGQLHQVRAERDIILAAGAINSPQLLQRSGIGAADALQQLGIAVQQDLPGVGANLQDHMEVYVQQGCRGGVSLNRKLGLISKGLIGARWLLRRDGLGATNHFETGGFIRSAAGQAWPDIQFHFLPVAMRYDGRSHASVDGFQAHVGPMLPDSRGSVALASADPTAAPRILFNYLQEASDRAVFRAAIRHTREIFAQAAFDPWREAELSPGVRVQTDAELDAFVRANAESAYHPCGTCRMGAADDPGAVVDPECRVLGVDGLRVVDTSVFPRITNGNLNMPAIMLAERAADMVLGRPLLPAEPMPVWQDAQWQQRQRPGESERPVGNNNLQEH